MVLSFSVAGVLGLLQGSLSRVPGAGCTAGRAVGLQSTGSCSWGPLFLILVFSLLRY